MDDRRGRADEAEAAHQDGMFEVCWHLADRRPREAMNVNVRSGLDAPDPSFFLKLTEEAMASSGLNSTSSLQIGGVVEPGLDMRAVAEGHPL